MHRRQFLSATAGVTALSGLAAGSPTSDSQSRQTAFEPLGSVAVEGIKEAVVGPAGETAYAATADGFATIDVSDPTAPTVLADRQDLLGDRENGPLEQIFDVKLDADRLAVVGPANPREDALMAAVLYDVSDPAAPEQLAVYDTTYPIHNCYFKDGILYLTGNARRRKELVMVALCGGTPHRVGSWSISDHDSRWDQVAGALKTLHDIYVQDGTAYLAHWDAGTWIVDVSDPSDPAYVSRVRGRSPDRLASLGIRGAAIESIQPPGNDHYVAVDEAGTLLALGVESWDNQPGDGKGGPGGIELYDISDPTDPTKLSTIDPPSSPDASYGGTWTTSHNFDLANGRLYSSWYQGGLKVFDVSDPATPTELAAWREDETASFWTAQFAGDSIVASSGVDRQDGLDIPDRLYTFPDPPRGEDEPDPPASGAGTTGSGSASAAATDPPVCERLDSITTEQPPGTGMTTEADTTNTTSTTATTQTATSTDEGAPGFGILATLAGLGLGADQLRRRRE